MIRKLRASALIVATACLGFSPDAQAGKADDTLSFAFADQPPTLDIYVNTGRQGIVLSRSIWDSLLYRDPQTNEYLPNLATSYKWINDTTMEFELRQGVTFHNGEPFDADDVVYTINWAIDPNSGIRTRRNVDWMKGAEKLGDYKVRILLKEPFPAALEYLAGPVLIYPNEYYAKVGTEGMGVAPVGTGPYKVTAVEPGKRITMERFENYFDGPKGKARIGEVRAISEVNTQLAELLSGRLDLMWRVPTDQAEKLAAMGRVTVKGSATMRIGYISFDVMGRVGKGPMNDLRVRQAIAHAIDRKGIVKALVKGEADVVHSACFPSQVGCSDDVTRYDYDPAKAKALLAEAGYPDGFETPFYAYRDRRLSEAIIANLAAVGIKTQYSHLKYTALRAKVQAGEVPFQFMTWGSYSINDTSAITGKFFKGGKDDYAHDPDVAKWLEIADTSTDLAVRKENYRKALRRIADQVYWLPLWSYNTNYAMSKDLEFEPTSDEIPRFYLMHWK